MSALIKAAEKTVAVKTRRKIRDQDIEYALEKNASNVFTVYRDIHLLLYKLVKNLLANNVIMS